MRKPILGGLLVALLVGLAAASVQGAAPPSVSPTPAPNLPIPKVVIVTPTPTPTPPPAPAVVEITCPMTVDIEHSVKTPTGFRSFSSGIRGYSHSLCLGAQAMAASDMSKAASCYYCDNQRTQLVRMDAPYPEGKTHCERVGASNRFSCQ